ncbi:MAG TPA: hypothetical protein ENN33_02775, partial [Ignavibacteria bacterium]|nr:hypothetical protein [Ignavibacteria bacterium]
MFFKWSRKDKKAEGFSTINNTCCFFFRGYVIWNHKLFFGNDFLPILKNHIRNDELDKNIRQYNGIFNIVLSRNNSVKVYNDRWGGFPLYYYQGTNELVISNNWQRILPHLPARKIQKNAALEMHTFGYVMGEKTLVENIYEFLPHTVTEIDLNENQIKKNINDYWQFHYPFNNHKKAKQLEREFADLWKQQIRVYTDFLSENDRAAYIPLSGGLDSRLLLYYVDRAGIKTNTMTYGAS